MGTVLDGTTAPMFGQGGSYSARNMRRLVAALRGNRDGLTYTAGNFYVGSSSANLRVSAKQGSQAFVWSAGKADLYLVDYDAGASYLYLPIPAVSSGSQKHVAYLAINDTEAVAPKWTFGLATGAVTSGEVPTAPPASEYPYPEVLRLAEITVKAGATGLGPGTVVQLLGQTSS
jgi:hypothetical protein